MRSRIVSLKMVDPSTLADHPHNWREHPSTQQAALREVFERIGIADVILAYDSAKTGKLTIIDGHLRRKMLAGEPKVAVLKLDLTDEEAEAVLASHDPIGAMAVRDEDLYRQLVEELATRDDFADIARMLDTDRWRAPDSDPDAGNPFESTEPAAYELAPEWDEGYDAVIVTAATEQEWAQLRTLLDLPQRRERKGRVGVTHVLTFEEFAQRWQAKQAKTSKS
jgi:hypothetical protein